MSTATSSKRGGGLARLRVALGVGAVAVSVVGIGGAMALAQWFSLTGHALSDLGALGRSTAPLFNGSLLLGGALGCGFVVTAWPTVADPVRRGALVVLFPAMGFMALVGAFPLPTAPHGVVAVLFFLLMTLGVFVWATGDLAAGRPARGAALVVGAVLHVVAWCWWVLFDWPGEGPAVPELVGAATLAVWALWVAADAGSVTPFRRGL